MAQEEKQLQWKYRGVTHKFIHGDLIDSTWSCMHQVEHLATLKFLQIVDYAIIILVGEMK